MKRKASEVLSVGGAQIDEKGVELRKKVATTAGTEKEARLPAEDASNQSASNSKSIVVNVTFTGCSNATCIIIKTPKIPQIL